MLSYIYPWYIHRECCYYARDDQLVVCANQHPERDQVHGKRTAAANGLYLVHNNGGKENVRYLFNHIQKKLCRLDIELQRHKPVVRKVAEQVY